MTVILDQRVRRPPLAVLFLLSFAAVSVIHFLVEVFR